MIVGTTIFYLDGEAYYSPAFARGGLGVVFAVDVSNISLPGATQFDITVETRNSEDTSWGALASFDAITAIGVHEKNYTGIKEIVRFKYGFSGGTPVAADAVTFLMQAPSWRPYA